MVWKDITNFEFQHELPSQSEQTRTGIYRRVLCSTRQYSSRCGGAADTI